MYLTDGSNQNPTIFPKELESNDDLSDWDVELNLEDDDNRSTE